MSLIFTVYTEQPKCLECCSRLHLKVYVCVYVVMLLGPRRHRTA